MTNKYDLETQQIIADLDKQAKEIQAKIDELKGNAVKKNVRWRAECRHGSCSYSNGETYYFLDKNGSITWNPDRNYDTDRCLYSIGNYFKTKGEAEKYKKHLLITQKIKDIALRLNDGVEIDWENTTQDKYEIGFSYYSVDGHLCIISTNRKVQWVNGNIYCLSDKFLETAINEIGEKELIEYIKGC